MVTYVRHVPTMPRSSGETHRIVSVRMDCDEVADSLNVSAHMNEIMENRGISIPKNPHAPKKLFIAIPLFPAQRIAFYPCLASV